MPFIATSCYNLPKILDGTGLLGLFCDSPKSSLLKKLIFIAVFDKIRIFKRFLVERSPQNPFSRAFKDF